MDDHDFEHLDENDARRALELLGVEIDDTGAPDDPDERTSGYLATLMAACQAHIQTRQRHAQLIGDAYHSSFEYFTGSCPAGCNPDDGFH